MAGFFDIFLFFFPLPVVSCVKRLEAIQAVSLPEPLMSGFVILPICFLGELFFFPPPLFPSQGMRHLQGSIGKRHFFPSWALALRPARGEGPCKFAGNVGPCKAPGAFPFFPPFFSWRSPDLFGPPGCLRSHTLRAISAVAGLAPFFSPLFSKQKKKPGGRIGQRSSGSIHRQWAKGFSFFFFSWIKKKTP